jgi:proton-dependent oligopeptide transporter, POT family
MASHNKEKVIKSIPQTGFFGHPKGLFTLFFTEFWERFSYYGMKAILVYYMYYSLSKGGLGIDQTTAASITSIYGSLVYMSGIIGGWIADRLIGPTKTVFYGGILIMLGHIALAIPGGISALFISMVLIVLGTGLLKPNVSNIVGDLYSEEDTRRDSGFSIFYMGINAGAFIAPLIVGTIGQKYNFHLGFGLAAIGMFLGLIVFLVTKRKNLGLAGTIAPNPIAKEQKGKVFGSLGIIAIIIIILAVAGISNGMLNINRFILLISILGVIIPICYFVVMFTSKRTTAVERSRLIAYIPLFIASVMFWAIEEQGSSLLSIYADQRTQLHFAGMNIEPAWFQSLNPLFIIVFAPVFAWLWMKLGNRQPSTPKKFSFGLILAGLSFIVMMLPALLNSPHALVNPLWLVLSYFLVVIGELCLSPVGLSATTKLAPKAFSAQTMSLWFLSNAAAQALNAQLVKLYNPATENIYFGSIGIASIILGILLLAISPKIQGFMKGVR